MSSRDPQWRNQRVITRLRLVGSDAVECGRSSQTRNGRRIFTTMFPGGSAVNHRWPPHSWRSSWRAPRSTPGFWETVSFGRARVNCSGGWRGPSHRCDGDQRVMTSPDVGVVCDELLIHDNGRELNFQPPTDWHPFTAVARQIDEESLTAVGPHIHAE